MDNTLYEFGMIGLGTMGRNLLLNMAEHGIAGAGFDVDPVKSDLLAREAGDAAVKGFTGLQPFIQSLRSPRAIMMLVPAGQAVDEVIGELLPFLNSGDILIDGGNSHFTDTGRRADYLSSRGLHFFGMGISGGEEGARRGPSLMPGGDKGAYAAMQPVLESIAAKVNGEPCVTYIGPGASGHFVKMVHNGIEYGLMQLIAEAYGFMKQLLQMDNEAIGAVFARWNAGRLQSFLLEITQDIFAYKEDGSGLYLLDLVKDEAKAKGTGKWTSQVAMDLETPVPTIDTAVAMRDLSKYKQLRVALAPAFEQRIALPDRPGHILQQLEQAFYCCMALTYAQGMHLLSRASVAYRYGLDPAAIARIWRGGCIIRSAFLEDMYQAYSRNKDLEHLLHDSSVQEKIAASVPGARAITGLAVAGGIAMPAFAATLGYFDSIRSADMPSNLIQAQRDMFGAHTYERKDKAGIFHTQWQPR